MDTFVSTSFISKDFETAVRTIFEKLGTRNVEFGSFHEFRSDIVDTAVRLKRELDLRVTIHNYFPPEQTNLVMNLGSLNESSRRASLAVARAAIDLARRVDAYCYTFHPAYPFEGSFFGPRFNVPGLAACSPAEPVRQKFRESLGELLDLSSAQGVRIAVENMWTRDVYLYDTAEEFEPLFAEFKQLGLLLDIGHASTAPQRPEDYISRFEKRIICTHISDNRCLARDEHLPLGRGKIDFNKYADILTTRPAVIEMEEAGLAGVIESIAHLKKLGL